MQKIFLINKCLTEGIIEVEAELGVTPVRRGFCGAGAVKTARVHGAPGLYHSSEFRETRQAAVARAEELRQQKIKTLTNQLKYLEQLSFK